MGQSHATTRRRTAGTSRVAAGLVAIAAACLAVAALAGAETFGQIGSPFGSFGTGKGQFRNPAMFGVDPTDGSVYAGDVTSDGVDYRIQKLTSAGAFKASALIPRFDDAEETKIVALHGIAVDHEKERFYVIDGCRVASGSSTCKKTGTLFGARSILVYKTAPEGETLVPAGSPISLPEGAEELYTPQSIAVDPANNDIVVMAEDSAKHIVIQRISSTGTLGARFVDTSNVLRPAAGREATSIAVGPTGITYTLTGAPGSPGAKFTRAWELPSNLSSVEEVSGFAASAEAEEWFFGLQSQKSPTLLGGPQVAISPDGETLYWKESQTASSESEAGSMLVRGYSLSAKKTSVVYGGSQGSSCKITTSQAGIATTGSHLIVFDYGPGVEGEKVPAYGDDVLTFGAGGSGCPIPMAKFTVNGFEQAEVKVEQGAAVSFNASGSELYEGFRRELIWKFGDGSEEKVTTTIDENEVEVEVVPTASHTYASAGKFTVSLEIKLKNAAIANVGPVEHAVTVQGGVPSFLLKVKKTGTGTVTSSPGGINCGSGASCEALFSEGSTVTLSGTPDAGSKAVEWTGCGEVTEGKCKVTMSAAKEVTAKFDLEPGHLLLEVKKAGSGTGTVTSSPAGINCGGECEAAFVENEVVVLSGASGANTKPVQWTGCGEVTGEGKCKVTLSAAKEVTATFDLEQRQLKIAKAGDGSGTVTSNPTGIECGATCQASYAHGVAVTLKGVSGADTKAVAWTGCDSIVGSNECKVTMTAAKEVTATFDSNPPPPPLPSGGGSTPPSGSPPPTPPVETKPKLTPKQKALAKCKKLKGKAKAKCVKKANSIGKPKKKHRRRGRG